MTTGKKLRGVARALAVVLALSGGGVLERGGAWVVHHDSVNYGLHDAGFGFLSDASEVAFAVGQVLWAGGIVLGTPLLSGFLWRVICFRRLLFLQVLVYAALFCGMASSEPIPFLGSLVTLMTAWVAAMVVAATAPTRPKTSSVSPLSRSSG